MEYKNSANAEEAVKSLNNHRLDKSHTLAVNLFTDFQKYENIPVEWEPPTPQPYNVQNDLYNYLTEPDGYDQFCVSAETSPNSVQVQFWQNTLPEPTDVETREVSFLYFFSFKIETNFFCFSDSPILLLNGHLLEHTLLPSINLELLFGVEHLTLK